MLECNLITDCTQLVMVRAVWIMQRQRNIVNECLIFWCDTMWKVKLANVLV